MVSDDQLKDISKWAMEAGYPLAAKPKYVAEYDQVLIRLQHENRKLVIDQEAFLANEKHLKEFIKCEIRRCAIQDTGRAAKLADAEAQVRQLRASAATAARTTELVLERLHRAEKLIANLRDAAEEQDGVAIVELFHQYDASRPS